MVENRPCRHCRAVFRVELHRGPRKSLPTTKFDETQQYIRCAGLSIECSAAVQLIECLPCLRPPENWKFLMRKKIQSVKCLG